MYSGHCTFVYSYVVSLDAGNTIMKPVESLNMQMDKHKQFRRYGLTGLQMIRRQLIHRFLSDY